MDLCDVCDAASMLEMDAEDAEGLTCTNMHVHMHKHARAARPAFKTKKREAWITTHIERVTSLSLLHYILT